MAGNTERRNDNMTPSLTVKSNANNNNDVVLWGDPSTHRLLVDGSFSGSLSNNNAAPGSTNLGALVAVANAAAPSYTEGNQVLLSTDLSGALRITGSIAVGGTTDNSVYTAGTSTGTPSMGFYHSTIDTVTDGRAATVAITNKRAMYVSLFDASGNALLGQKTTANSIPIALASDATLPVTNAGTFAVQSTPVTQADTFMLGGINIKEINAVTPLMGNGITGTGSLRVTIASDNTAFAVNATLSAETTKVIGVVRNADGAGNLLTTNSTTYTAKFGLDGNLLGTLGTAFSTAGKVDVKAADGDVFVRQTTGSNLHMVVDSGTVTTVSTVTNLSQMNGAALLMGNGITGTGSQRVTIASDNTAFTVNPASATAPVSTMNSASAAAGLNSAMAAVFDDVSPTAITENNFGFVRMSTNRNQYVTIRDAAGNERGLNIDASGQLAITLASAQTLATVTTVTTVSTVTNLAQMNGAALLMGNGVTGTGSQRVTLASDNSALPAWGHGATAATAPAGATQSGALGKTALPTAVSDGQLVGMMADKFGRPVVLVGSIRDLTATQTTTISASTSETTIVTAGASGILNDLVMLIISNTSTATNTRIDFRDATAGTILFSLQSNGGQPPVGFALPVPIPQTTAANNWTAQCATSTTDVRVYAVYVKNK